MENEAAVDHPGNAVVKPLTVGLDPWETHQLGGDNNTTNKNNVKKCIKFDLSLFLFSFLDYTHAYDFWSMDASE